MSDYRFTVKVQNNNIVGRILDAGYKTIGEFCRLNKEMKSAQSSLGEIINMKESPLTAKGDFKRCVKLAAFSLGCSPEDFFTDSQLQCAMETNRRVIEVSEAEMRFALNSKVESKQLEDQVMEQRLPSEIAKLLETLTPREAKIISMRYGINSEPENTTQEVADRYGVTPSRIRQIEARALRKLRNPYRSKTIKEFIEN